MSDSLVLIHYIHVLHSNRKCEKYIQVPTTGMVFEVRFVFVAKTVHKNIVILLWTSLDCVAKISVMQPGPAVLSNQVEEQNLFLIDEW